MCPSAVTPTSNRNQGQEVTLKVWIRIDCHTRKTRPEKEEGSRARQSFKCRTPHPPERTASRVPLRARSAIASGNREERSVEGCGIGQFLLAARRACGAAAKGGEGLHDSPKALPLPSGPFAEPFRNSRLHVDTAARPHRSVRASSGLPARSFAGQARVCGNSFGRPKQDWFQPRK